jgi:hypothetical protein
MAANTTTIKELRTISFIVALCVAVRGVTMWASPHLGYLPSDVYYVDAQAASAVAHLDNPYHFTYVLYGFETRLMAYLPLIPIYYAPFSLLGDIRYGSIFADAVITISLYVIGRSLSRSGAAYASLAYALFPVSIALTSMAGTNMMVGSMFLVASLAALIRNRYVAGAVLLGLALAANQLVLLAFPLFAYYYWRNSKMRYIGIAVLVSAVLILPFFVSEPTRFAYDVIYFQFSRQLQYNGWAGLYSLVYRATGVELSSAARLIIFGSASAGLVAAGARSSKPRLIVSVAAIIAVGAFVLPVDGFWNYFLVPSVVAFGLLPSFAGRLRFVLPVSPAKTSLLLITRITTVVGARSSRGIRKPQIQFPPPRAASIPHSRFVRGPDSSIGAVGGYLTRMYLR